MLVKPHGRVRVIVERSHDRRASVEADAGPVKDSRFRPAFAPELAQPVVEGVAVGVQHVAYRLLVLETLQALLDGRRRHPMRAERSGISMLPSRNPSKSCVTA